MSNDRPFSVTKPSQRLRGINAFLDQIAFATHEQMRSAVLRWLQTEIVFDSAILAHGTMKRAGAEMGGWIVGDQSRYIFEDYLDIPAHAQPSRGLSASLDHPKIINVARHVDHCRSGGGLLAYLVRNRIRHLLIKGIRLSHRPGLAWLILVRQTEDPKFDHVDKVRVSAAISTILHACDHACMFAGPSSSACAVPSRQTSVIYQEGATNAAMPLLTGRQHQVLQALLQGWSNKLIARHLAISDNTLKTHLQSIYQTLGVQSRSQAILVAMHSKVLAGTS